MGDDPHADAKRFVELAISYRYAQAHGWVVNAVTGWLSAYYMEDSRFRVSRRYEELETGLHVWLCELDGDVSLTRLLRRLQVDIPPFQVRVQQADPGGRTRHVIDLPEEARAPS